MVDLALNHHRRKDQEHAGGLLQSHDWLVPGIHYNPVAWLLYCPWSRGNNRAPPLKPESSEYRLESKSLDSSAPENLECVLAGSR